MAAMRRSLAPVSDNALNVRGSLVRKPNDLASGMASMSMTPSSSSSSEEALPLASNLAAVQRPPVRGSMVPSRGSLRLSIGGNALGNATLGQAASAPNEARPKDPRNLSDPGFRTLCTQNLVRFLVANEYPLQISAKELSPPTLKTFMAVFNFLYTLIDPNYKMEGKFDEIAPQLVRHTLRYPFAHEITRSAISEVGSPRAWPNFLGLLTWMVELIMCCVAAQEESEASGDTNQQLFASVSNSYTQWMAYVDDTTLAEAMQAEFDQRNRHILDQRSALQQRRAQVLADLERLEREQPPLKSLEQRRNESRQTVDGLAKLVEALQQHVLRAEESIQQARQEMAQRDIELQSAQSKKMDVLEKIASQEIKLDDVKRMQADKERLDGEIREVTAKAEEVQGLLHKEEIENAKQVAVVSGLLKSQADALVRLGVRQALPSIGQVASIPSYIDTVLRPALLSLRDSQMRQQGAYEDKRKAMRLRSQNHADEANSHLEEVRRTKEQTRRVREAAEAHREKQSREHAALLSQAEVLDRQVALLEEKPQELDVEQLRRKQGGLAADKEMLVAKFAGRAGPQGPDEVTALICEYLQHRVNVENMLKDFEEEMSSL